MPLETDYLIVGAGAAGMAFAYAFLTHSDATITILDRDAPGGHWRVKRFGIPAAMNIQKLLAAARGLSPAHAFVARR